MISLHWLPFSTQGHSWYGGTPPKRPCTGRDRDLSPRRCLGQPAPAAPRTRPQPHPSLTAPPRTCSVSTVPSGSGALQGRHLLRWVSLAPDRSRLHLGWEPAPGTSGPASLGRRPTPEAVRESYKSPMRSRVGRCLLSTELCTRPAGGASLRRQFLVMPLPAHL